MPRTIEIALDEALAASEGGHRLAGRRLEHLTDLVALPGDLQAASAATVSSLDRDRQAVGVGEGEYLVRICHRIGGAGHQRGTHPLRDVAGLHLVAECLDGCRGRADPGQAGVDDSLRESGVLRQEPVAGMNCVRPAAFRDVQQLVDVEVGLSRGGATKCERLVREFHEQCSGI